MNDLKQLILQNADGFNKRYNREAILTAAAPGRINIIGEHTDYNEGLSLATAINRWVLVSIAKREDNLVVVQSSNYNSSIQFEIGEILSSDDKWHCIVSGSVKILSDIYGLKTGFDAYIWGNVPEGSGVSSSAAIEVAFYNALRTLYQLDFNDGTLVSYCQQTEHIYLHVKSGILDQYSSQFSKENNFVQIDFRTKSHQYIPVDIKNYKWVLVNSMVKRELSGSKYSERVEETQKAFFLIKNAFDEVKHFRDIKLKHAEILTDSILKKRIIHYVEENARVVSCVEALKNHDLVSVGKYLNASHRSLKDNYEVSCSEIDFLVEKANLISGCLGSRMMGGGFGGCTINLVKEENIEEFKEQISLFYYNKFMIETDINIYKSVNGAVIDNHENEMIENNNKRDK